MSEIGWSIYVLIWFFIALLLAFLLMMILGYATLGRESNQVLISNCIAPVVAASGVAAVLGGIGIMMWGRDLLSKTVIPFMLLMVPFGVLMMAQLITPICRVLGAIPQGVG